MFSSVYQLGNREGGIGRVLASQETRSLLCLEWSYFSYQECMRSGGRGSKPQIESAIKQEHSLSPRRGGSLGLGPGTRGEEEKESPEKTLCKIIISISLTRILIKSAFVLLQKDV